MKKKISRIIVSMIAILFVLSTLTACIDGVGGSIDGVGGSIDGVGGSIKGKALKNMLKNSQIDLRGVESLGIFNKKPTAATARKATAAETEPEKKNYFVSFDSEGKISEVVFFKTVVGKDEAIMQEEISAQIDKMFIASHFTYIRFTIKTPTADFSKLPSDYYTKDYFCNDEFQSFAIDNVTGKVYSFDGLGVIEEVGDSYIKSKGTYYKPEIETSNLVLNQYVDNPNINVLSVDEDKYGTIFVENDTTFEKIGNTIYYKNRGDKFMMGEDQVMYTIGDHYGGGIEVKRYNNTRSLVSVGEDTVATICSSSFGDYNYLIKGNMLYEFSIWGLETYCYNNGIFDDADYIYSGVSDFTAAGGEIYGITEDSGKLCNYKAVKTGKFEYDGSPKCEIQEIAIGISATRIISMGDYLMVTTEKVNSTEKRKVTMNGNLPVVELLDSQIYTKDLITISPIN